MLDLLQHACRSCCWWSQPHKRPVALLFFLILRPSALTVLYERHLKRWAAVNVNYEIQVMMAIITFLVVVNSWRRQTFHDKTFQLAKCAVMMIQSRTPLTSSSAMSFGLKRSSANQQKKMDMMRWLMISGPEQLKNNEKNNRNYSDVYLITTFVSFSLSRMLGSAPFYANEEGLAYNELPRAGSAGPNDANRSRGSYTSAPYADQPLATVFCSSPCLIFPWRFFLIS